jgi:hypothetical protein
LRVLAIVALLISLSVPVRAPAADDDQRVGQYFCYVENAAGIQKHENQPTFAGKITLPEEDKKFFVRIKRVDRELVKELCAKSAQAFKEALESGSELERFSSKLYGTSSFAEVCLRKFKAEIPQKSSNSPWAFFGTGAYEFSGVVAHMSLTLYGNNEFTMVFPYDDGPVVETGRCEKIQASE